MAAILRTGKFLRLFSGVARNLAAGPNKNDDNSLVPQNGLLFDKTFSSQVAAGSLQNVLPYIGVSDSGHAEDRFPTRLLGNTSRSLGRVTKEEIEMMVQEIEASEADTKTGTMNLLSSQALLAIRLCGAVLDQELPSTRSQLVSRVWDVVGQKGINTTVLHYNALLRVHLENGHHFLPDKVLEDMRCAGVTPDKETYQCMISRYCQEGDIEGASKVLQMMKTSGIKVNENIFNSLIMGHGESGDLARAHGMLKVMKTWGLSPSSETFLTLACVYAKQGDWAGVERVVSEGAAQEVNFQDGDFLELLYVLCEGGHKEHIGKVLALTHPETEQFSEMAGHLVVRLVNRGHDDVAYNLVQYTVDNTTEEAGSNVCSEFLDQLVHVNRPVTKLIWIVNDMAERRLLTGGLDHLVELAIKDKNFSLGYRLADILVGEGGKLTDGQFTELLSLAASSKSEDNIISCVKIGNKLNLLTPEVLKKQIFPQLDSWPELVIANLEEAGMKRDVTTTPMVEWLVGQGKTEAAATVAGIFSEHVDPKLKFLTAATKTVNAVCNHFHEEQRETEPQPVKSVKPNINELNQGELELMLSPERNTTPETRGEVYLRLLDIFTSCGSMDQAIELSRRLKSEQDVPHLPQFYDKLGSLMESHFNQMQAEQYQSAPPAYQTTLAYQFSPQMGQFVPVPVVATHYPPDQYYPQPWSTYPTYYTSPTDTSDQSEVTSTANQSQASTPCPTDSSYTEFEYNHEAAQLHRNLKRAISAGNTEEGLSLYRAMERLGRSVNVTETSSLVELLVRADMMAEAGEVTRGMLARDTHPLPKIFRFLLNKLAIMGSVDEILAVGQYLPSKIKKDVSFDNRLCNAYLSAGRGAEFLGVLVKDLEEAVRSGDKERIALVKDKFPRGGAMGLLDSHPELLERYTDLAHKFAAIDYVAPMNVLWTYHFIHGNKEVAGSIWQDYVRSSNQIMFQKVCQVARATGNIDLAFGLVEQLSGAEQVTSGARGIAYSCLLDTLCANNEHKKGWQALQEALGSKVGLEDINRTALVRLKLGLEGEGAEFPYQIPPKNIKKDLERSLSPVDWNDM